MTAAWFTDSVTRLRAGPSSIRPPSTVPSIMSHRAGEPTVSTTRWMRGSPEGFTTLWMRHVSNTHAWPGAMWTTSSPQVKSTPGVVTTGMCTRSRSCQ